jgi:Protein of unknown function (DUF992)
LERAGQAERAPKSPKKEFDMQKTIRLLLGAAVAVAGLAAANAAEAAPHGIKVGELTCNVSSGWGFVFGSSKDLHCTFRPNSHRPEHYIGTISKFGVDIGYTEGGVLVWGVFAPASDIRAGALAGDYAGATASATVGIGLGANVLVGGLDKSIALQPLSIEGNKGLNVAAGIGAIDLKSAP